MPRVGAVTARLGCPLAASTARAGAGLGMIRSMITPGDRIRVLCAP